MSLNYVMKSRPPKWISAHRENRYVINFEKHNVLGTYNASGYFGAIFSTSLGSPVVGDRVYIYAGSGSNGLYTGFHVIRAVISGAQIIFETTYAGVLTGVNSISLIVLPTVKIYKGYKVGELILTHDSGTLDLYDIQPYQLVGEFQPEANINGEIDFDFCGYAKTAIESPYKAGYNVDELSYAYPSGSFVYTPMQYAYIRLVLGGGCIGSHYAANAAISTEELNRGFVDTDRQLGVLKQPISIYGQFTKGNYINTNLLTEKTI